MNIKIKSGKLFKFILLIVFILAVLYPTVWILRMSFQRHVDAFSSTQKLFFKPILNNYLRLIKDSQFPSRFLNSFIEAGLSTFLALFIGIPAAYVFSRLQFKFKNILLVFILSSRMIPPISLLIPYFLVFNNIGLIDTRIGMILVYTVFNLGLVIWAMWSFFDDIPKEMDEAAEVDGASVIQTLYKVIVPVSTAGITSIAILCFVMAWNDFIFALMLTRSRAVTAPIELASKALAYQSEDITLVAAGCIIVAAPAIIFTVILRKYLQKGLLAGAVKG